MIDANLESSKTGGTRRIMAVLMSDVYGFTSAVGKQEEFAASRVEEDLAEFANIIVANKGQVVADRGDGVKAVFDSGVDALRAALQMQSLVLQKNAKLGPNALRVRHRVGIHVGDVIISGDHYTGLAVAIAARLEALCPPGKVAFTDTVHEMTRQTLHFDRSFMGQYEVKNVEHPVRVWVGRIPGDLESIAMPTSAVVAGKRKEIVIQQKSHDGFWKAITVVILLVVVTAVGFYLQKMVLSDSAEKGGIVVPQGSTGTTKRSNAPTVDWNTPTPGLTTGGGSGNVQPSPRYRPKAKPNPAPEQRSGDDVPEAGATQKPEPKVDPHAAATDDEIKKLYPNVTQAEKKTDPTPDVPAAGSGDSGGTGSDQQATGGGAGDGGTGDSDTGDQAVGG